MKINRSFVIRFIVFITGLFISGFGVALTKTGALGVSPVSSVANVFSIRFPVLTIGNWLIIWNCILILGQVLILRQQFKIWQLLQIPLSFLFGYFTDFGMFLCAGIPQGIYWIQALCVVLGTLVLGLGVTMTVKANVIMNSGEAFVKAVSDKCPLEFGTIKILFDVSCVVLSVICSLCLCGGKIVGTREGTVFAAVMVGVFVKFFSKLYGKISAFKKSEKEVSYKAVFADLDRTLLRSDATISDFTKETLEKLLASGVDFVPCSGRALNSLPDFIFDIKGIRHAVTSNGVSVDDIQNRKSLEYLLISPEVPEKLFKYLENEEVQYEIFIDGQGYVQKEYLDDPHAFDEVTFRVDYLQRTRRPVEDIKAFILEHKNEIGSLEVIIHPKDAGRIYNGLKEKFPEIYMTNSEPFLVEVSNLNCGKHNGLKRYCSIMGIKPEQVIAFGDGNNDIEMLQAAGFGISVANAVEECKKASKKVVLSNDEDGVAKEIVEIFGL